MSKINEQDTLKNLNKIYTNLKPEILHEMQDTDTKVSDVCYDIQLTQEQFTTYLSSKSDVGFCVDTAKELVKRKSNSRER